MTAASDGAAVTAALRTGVFWRGMRVRGRRRGRTSEIRTIDVSHVTGELADCLTREDMAQVEHDLSRYFGLLH